MHAASSRSGKPARIIASGDRPGVLAGVDCRPDRDGLGGETEDVGNDLRRRGAVTLALRHRVDSHRNAAERVEAHRGGSLGSILGPAPVPLLGLEHGRYIAHVRDRRLDHRGKASAIEPTLTARPIAPMPQLGQTAALCGDMNRSPIVPRIEYRASRTAVRKCLQGGESREFCSALPASRRLRAGCRFPAKTARARR